MCLVFSVCFFLFIHVSLSVFVFIVVVFFGFFFLHYYYDSSFSSSCLLVVALVVVVVVHLSLLLCQSLLQYDITPWVALYLLSPMRWTGYSTPFFFFLLPSTSVPTPPLFDLFLCSDYYYYFLFSCRSLSPLFVNRCCITISLAVLYGSGLLHLYRCYRYSSCILYRLPPMDLIGYLLLLLLCLHIYTISFQP